MRVKAPQPAEVSLLREGQGRYLHLAPAPELTRACCTTIPVKPSSRLP
jgi:alanine dehydrogenase